MPDDATSGIPAPPDDRAAGGGTPPEPPRGHEGQGHGPPPAWAVPDPAAGARPEPGAAGPAGGGWYPPPHWPQGAPTPPPPFLQGQPPRYQPPPPQGYPTAEVPQGAGFPPYGGFAPTAEVAQGAGSPPYGGGYAPPAGPPVPGSPFPPGSQPPPDGYGNYPYGWYPQPYGWHYGAPPAPARVRTPEERRRRRRHGLMYGATVLVLAGIGIGLGLWLAPTPPATVARGLAKQAVAAGDAAGSFHYVQRSTEDGIRDVIVGDAGPDGGQQLITQEGSSGTNVYRLRLVHGVVYFRGNRAAVIDQLGVPQARAAADVGRWISVRKGEGPYASFAAGITTKSNLSQLPETFVPLTSTTTSSSSPPTTRISGGVSAGKGRQPVGTARLVVTTSSMLPRSFAANAITDVHLLLSWQFDRWGVPVHVPAPAGAVPYSSLGASSPSRR